MSVFDSGCNRSVVDENVATRLGWEIHYTSDMVHVVGGKVKRRVTAYQEAVVNRRVVMVAWEVQGLGTR